jgi:hypothetical protein
MKGKAQHKRTRRQRSSESSPVTILEAELHGLHRDLRTIAKAYIARLENDLFVCLAALRLYGAIEQVPREMLYQIRDLAIAFTAADSHGCRNASPQTFAT